MLLKAGAGAAAKGIVSIAARTGRSAPEVLRLLLRARALGREGSVLREALARSQAGKALTAEQAGALGRARAKMRQLHATGAGLVDQIDVAAEGAYAAIRNNPHDVGKIAATMGVPVEVVERAKRHLLLEQPTLSTVVGEKPIIGHFVAIEQYAELWQKAERGMLTPDERGEVMKLLVHENVEARLKARGLALLEPVDLKNGVRPFRGVLAHDLAATAEQGFQDRAWKNVPEGTKKQHLRAILEAVFEVRGPYSAVEEATLPLDVRAEYRRLLGLRKNTVR